METSTAREDFCQAVQQETARLAAQVWERVVADGAMRDIDPWLREEGGAV